MEHIHQKSMKKISTLLGSRQTQRVIYSLGLVLWILIFWNIIRSGLWSSQSSFGISYLTLLLIPSCLLLLQIVLNKWILWLIITVSICSYFLYSSYMLLDDVLNRRLNPQHVKYLPLELADFLFFGVFSVLTFSIVWLLLKIKPRRLNVLQQ